MTDNVALISRETANLVPFDDSLNNLGWKMNDFLTENGAKFDGRVFNHLKGCLRECIYQWLADHPYLSEPVTIEKAAQVLLDKNYHQMVPAFDAMEKSYGEGVDKMLEAGLRALVQEPKT